MKLNKKIGVLLILTLLYSCAKTTYAQENSINSKLVTSEMFTQRDIIQFVDEKILTTLVLKSNEQTTINNEGIYNLTGNFTNTEIIIEAGENDKVQLVLDSLIISNTNKPVIYVKSADKVFITTTNSINSLKVTENYKSDGDTNLDAVIFSRSDLVINGIGTLNIDSLQGNGISTKDDLKITGGNILINSLKDGLEANDSIRIYDGEITINSGSDALHSENEDNLLKGYIYIKNANLNITAGDDGIRGTSIIQIDGGSITINNSQEGIEANQIQINGGEIDIYATDDGINATSKSSLDVIIEVYGGNIKVKMADGDTDAFDANGDIYIYGGVINVEGHSSFDADKTAKLISGIVIINGETVTELPESRNGRGKHR